MDNFIFFVKQGLFHVLDSNAYDHILFLIALTVIYTFKDSKKTLWLITLFTIGHTTSLVLSAYNVVAVNKKIVEFLIPLTIFITAIINIIFTRKSSKNNKETSNLFFAFFFGLIHGLGFSSYFKMIAPKGSNKLFALLEFALGIEFAQLIIVFILLIVSLIFQTVFRFSKKDWVLMASSIVIGFVIPMLIANKFW